MQSKQTIPHPRALLNYVLKLWGSKPSQTSPRRCLGEINIPAYDDLSAINCLRETRPDRLLDCDCAEFYAPDGRLIWEEGAGADGESSPRSDGTI